MSFAPGSVPQRGVAQSWAPASALGLAPRSGRGLDLPLLALEQKPMTASPMMASTRALRTRNLFIAKLLPKARARAWRAVVPMRAFARKCAACGRPGTARRGEGGWPAVLAARAAVAEAEPARQAVGRGRRQLPGAVVFLRV